MNVVALEKKVDCWQYCHIFCCCFSCSMLKHLFRGHLYKGINPWHVYEKNIFSLDKLCKNYANTVEPQWCEHPWDHKHLFEIWVVRATEGG